MSKIIYKYPLEVRGLQNLQLPEGAEILTVQPQGNQVCLWALVSPDKETASRTIWIIGTGHQIDTTEHLGRYVATFQLNAGELIFHVFEAKP